MKRLLNVFRCLLLIGGGQLLTTMLAVAQPMLLSERKNFKTIYSTSAKSFELPGHRFVHCGAADVRVLISSKTELTLVVTTAVGDTVRYRRLNRNAVGGGDNFTDAVLEADYSVTYLSVNGRPMPVGGNELTYSLTQIDTLGRVRWQRFYPFYPAAGAVATLASALLRVPDGYLVLTNPVAVGASTPTATYSLGGVAKFDRQGLPLWQRTWPSRGYGGVGELDGLVARADGSYLATGYVDNGTPYVGGAARVRFDHWLVQFTPQGDTIKTARFGVSGEFESGRSVYSTADGGVAVSGVRRQVSSSYYDAQLVKVDSLLRPQWTYTQPNTSNYDEAFQFVQPMRRGDIVFGGTRYIRATQEQYGALAAFTAGGVPRWNYQHHYGGNLQRPTGFGTMLSQPDSSAYLAGGTAVNINSTAYEDHFAHLANVGAPFVADLCRVRPVAVFGFAPTAGGDSLRFVSLSTAGPRYAALALWHWDFGDGTGYDGPSPPPHRYAGTPGAGTRVSLTVTNNLGCTSTQAVFPFALATAQARALAAQARLWPNPATGAATLEVAGLGAQGPVRLEVRNALGQLVLARTAVVRQGTVREVLAVGGLPAGVYAVRLLAREGTVVKRLIRE